MIIISNCRNSISKVVYHSSEINHEEPIASSQLVEVVLSFIDRLNQIYI